MTDELNRIIDRAHNAGKKIESSEFWDFNDGEYFYRHNYSYNCIEEDEDRVNEIFDEELSRFWTWSIDFDVFNAQIENESEESDEFEVGDVSTLPEGINYEKIRLFFKG